MAARTASKSQKEKAAKTKPVDLDIVKGVYKFITPEEIDGMIQAHMSQVRKTHQWKWDEDTLLLRNSVILEYICSQGLSNRRTAEQISSRWGISMDAARDWVKNALSTLAEYGQENIEDLRQKHLERLEAILEQSMADNAKDSALKAADQIAKLLGLNTDTTKVKLSGGDEPIKFDFGE